MRFLRRLRSNAHTATLATHSAHPPKKSNPVHLAPGPPITKAGNVAINKYKPATGATKASTRGDTRMTLPIGFLPLGLSVGAKSFGDGEGGSNTAT